MIAVESSAPARPSDPTAPNSRVVLIDALRGVCFVLMTVDHLAASPLHRVSNPYFGPFGVFTAALGFVFLSGLVAGRVYERERVTAGTGAMVRRVLRRSRALYLTHLFVFLAVVAAVELHLRGYERWNLDLVDGAPWKGLALGAGLVYEPGYFGILPMYILFLLATPFVLPQIARNWPRVLALSALVWIVSGLFVRLPEDPNGADFGAFNPFAYQLLFVTGLGFGAGYVRIDRIPDVVRERLVGAAVVVASLFLVLRWQYAWNGPLTGLVNDAGKGFSSEQLGPLRLLDFAAFALVLYWATRRFGHGQRSTGYAWLSFVGRHSLPVFAWSILAAYASVALLPSHLGVPAGLLVVAVLSASLTIPAQLHAFVRGRRTALTYSRGGRLHEAGAAPVGVSADLVG